ncbi:MAG: MBL fold metallo-hydrolase [Acidimicrobiales bacterium]
MATTSLTPIAPGVAAWLHDGPARFGRPNAGVVVDTDGLTVVDTLMVPSQWEPFGEALDSVGRPIKRVVLTSSHIPFVGGTGRFWAAAFYGTPSAADLLDLPPNVAGYRRLVPELAGEFPDDLATRPVSHTIERDATLTDAVVVRHRRAIGGELVVEVPGANVLFAGAMARSAAHPRLRRRPGRLGGGTALAGHTGPYGGARPRAGWRRGATAGAGGLPRSVRCGIDPARPVGSVGRPAPASTASTWSGRRCWPPTTSRSPPAMLELLGLA